MPPESTGTRSSANPVRTILAARAHLADQDQADQVIVRMLIDRLARQKGLSTVDWPTGIRLAPASLAAAREELDQLDLSSWNTDDIGAAYEHLLGKSGAWYTPIELAEAMVRLAIGPQLDRLAHHPDPRNVLQVLALDPSCGGGAFLLTAARFIAHRLADRLLHDISPSAVQTVMPEVLDCCIFGIDIDPIAVEISKAALWLEVRGSAPFTFMDRNIIVADALSGPAEPPRLTERRAGDDQPHSACPHPAAGPPAGR
jgi:type I restriction-modification system DNA methylase subunit